MRSIRWVAEASVVDHFVSAAGYGGQVNTFLRAGAVSEFPYTTCGFCVKTCEQMSRPEMLGAQETAISVVHSWKEMVGRLMYRRPELGEV